HPRPRGRMVICFLPPDNTCKKIAPPPWNIHPFSKKACICCVSNLDYTASAAVISIYHKICDTINDSNFIVSSFFRMIRLILRSGYKKAKLKYPDLCNGIEFYMSEQSKIENEQCNSIDLACEPTAQIMSLIAQGISENPEDKKHLSGLGYHLGRFTYIADAFDDLEKDIKNGNYNPLFLNFKDIKEAKKFAEENINMSTGMIAEFYSKINIPKFKEIIDNIIYLGLPNYKMTNKKERKKYKNKQAEV
ncbi:MAG: hypothetical protein K2F60_05850, partial [Oscillospiraceae bacterium]|nr:hypothetical protein [Oscillospiraceae bacterium]